MCWSDYCCHTKSIKNIERLLICVGRHVQLLYALSFIVNLRFKVQLMFLIDVSWCLTMAHGYHVSSLVPNSVLGARLPCSMVSNMILWCLLLSQLGVSWYLVRRGAAVNNHWTGLVEWTTGMDYWTDLFCTSWPLMRFL